MAKKRKPVSNPARGFATVSAPSRPKAQEASSDPDHPNASDAKNVGQEEGCDATPIGAPSVANSTNDPKEISALTPQQLEEHLEDAELENLVLKYGEQSKRDALRQVTRLETERRTLRAQAIPLETGGWLSQTLMDKTLDLQKSELTANSRYGLSSMNVTASSDEVLIKLWTLQQVLRSLQVPLETKVLRYASRAVIDFAASYRDHIWGLNESFEWLSLCAEAEDLPSLSSGVPVNGGTSNGDGEYASSADASRVTSPARQAAQPEGVDLEPLPQDSKRPGEAEEADQSEESDGSSDEDDSNEPAQLVDKYVDLRMAILRHELSVGSQDTADNNWDRKILGPRRIKTLRRRVGEIERDILFDKSAAAAHWVPISHQVHAEHAQSRSKITQSNSEAAPIVDPQQTSQETNVGTARSSDDDEDGLFGEMFDTAQKYTPGSRESIAIETDDSVLLIDFGKFGGVSPRKVLEEYCKLRDKRCLVTFRRVSTTSYSYRHTVEIGWSKVQSDQPTTAALPHQVSFKTLSLSFAATMEGIATPQAIQSEAYISTIALFALSSGQGKEKQVTARLSRVWRDLWDDLQRARDSAKTAVDKNDLRLLRSILESGEEAHGSEIHTESLDVMNLQQSSTKEKMTGTAGAASVQTPAQLQSLWQSKASTARYQTMFRARQQLPITTYQQQIIGTITSNQMTIICAETGAGKSTQVPSYLLEHELGIGRDCQILVTQPRRISAISLARRVSEELGEGRNDVGTHQSLVGYAIRLESKTSTSTRLTYATSGVLLRMLESSQDLANITHLVLDEVHERTMDLDLAFIAIKRIAARRPDLKVILMSATVDSEKFSRFFDDAPVLQVPGRTFPVEVKYLEDAIEETSAQRSSGLYASTFATDSNDNERFSDGERTTSVNIGLEEYSPNTRAFLSKYDEYRTDYTLITDLAAIIASHQTYQKYSRAILIFMPGIAEIRRLHQTFLAHGTFTQDKWTFHLLHSSFSSEDLERAFLPPPRGTRKIVIATNIAETGITIPDITAVIDTCKEKTMRFDERRQLSKLTENFTSKSSCRQRRGRAARVHEGMCWHLVTRHRFENLMSERHVPEMLRLSLQEPALRIKIWGLGGIEITLAQALDAPSSKNVRRAVEALKDAGALTDFESLTPLGRQLARLPLDMWLGKLAILGIAFGCLDAAITVASIMSCKSPFLVARPGDGRSEQARLVFKRAESDLLLDYDAYLGWRRACIAGAASEFTRKFYLDQQALSQIEDQKTQLLVSLVDTGLLALSTGERSELMKARNSGRQRNFFAVPSRYDTNGTNDNTLLSLIALAFYPKLLVREGKGWRNVTTNQQVQLSPTSINKNIPKPPLWLSFHETMQTKSRLPSVFGTSAVPESALVLLLGEAEFKLYSGVILIDGSKIRFSVRNWKVMIALKILRTKMQQLLDHAIRHPGQSLRGPLAKWADLWKQIIAPHQKNTQPGS